MSLADLFGDILASVVTPAMTASGLTWAQADQLIGRDFLVPIGEARVQILVGLASQSGDSNVSYLESEVVLLFAYAVPDGNPAPWLNSHLYTILSLVLGRPLWRSLGSVHDLVGGPEAGEPEQVGNVISVEVAARVRLKP